MSASTRVIGLMSGTSMDGIDVAFLETDGEAQIAPGPALTVPYAPEFRARLRSVLGVDVESAAVTEVERELTLLHVDAVKRLLDRHPTLDPQLIGFHGHTILHRPEARRTRQIGDGGLLAQALGVPVAFDFRAADVAAGGQGAPMVPVYHRGLVASLPMPLAVVNIGGVANVTWIGHDADDILAFDTGPGNALIDDWVLRHTGERYDTDGMLAASGTVSRDAVERFLAHPFFGLTPPKSLDRDSFKTLVPGELGAADGAATLTAITIATIAKAMRDCPQPPTGLLVSGGGRHNPVIMQGLAEACGAPVRPIDAIGWDGDAIEAQAFGYLAARAKAGLPLSFPRTTGVPAPMPGGRIATPMPARRG